MFTRPTTVTIAVLSLFCSLIAGSLAAQSSSTPSQRFTPQKMTPPSVHVPQQGLQRLPRSNSNPTTFNFSDTPASSFRQGAEHDRSTRQVSYNEEITEKPSRIPAIPALLRDQDFKKAPVANRQQEQRTNKPIQLDSAKATQDFGNQIVVDQAKFSPPRRMDDALSNSTSSRLQQVAFTDNEDGSQVVASGGGSVPVDNGVRSADFNRVLNSCENQVRRVAAESELVGSSINMATPGIRVQMFGPDSIGINKNAIYKVTVSNEGQSRAGAIQVGVNLPTTIELQNINVSTGHHELSDETENSRLLWSIDSLAPNTTHTIAINAIPRTAEPFDMQVEWSFERQQAASQVYVTQPQLEMKISGPTEVMYGEKVTYDVTVLNPGTGDAEQVAVMLPQELGGERASIGTVAAGGEKRFKVELFARTAGQLNLAATAVGEGNIEATANHNIRVRRANLNVAVEGPSMKYAGSLGQYVVTVTNDGDATASDVVAVFAMPNGVKYLGGINNVENSDGGLKWNIGTLTSGDQRTYKVNCQLDASGNLFFQAGARGAGELAATNECQTKVDTIADLTLSVQDPKGPLPTGENIQYKMIVRNRGTRSANSVNLVMQFSEGIEPIKADGFKHKITSGQVVFAPIRRIEPGQEIVLNVTAQALKSGTHVFRGQLTCEESDAREVDEGTTRFFGDDMALESNQENETNTADAGNGIDSEHNDFK